MRNRIITHNHPNLTSISINDLLLAWEARAQEVRAVTDKYVYSMKIKRGFSEETLREIIAAYNREHFIRGCCNFLSTEKSREQTHLIWQDMLCSGMYNKYLDRRWARLLEYRICHCW